MNETLVPESPVSDAPITDTLLWEALPYLTLNIAQTAALCGISVRQLGYWTRQGYVEAQGRGARRTYGLEAVRHVLGIRKTMDGGVSLRQALRQTVVPISITPATAASDTHLSPVPVPLPVGESQILLESLRTLFDWNKETRDHAGGLAVKLGRAEEDVRQVAESLCETGVLTKNVCQGMTIFHQADQEAFHV